MKDIKTVGIVEDADTLRRLLKNKINRTEDLICICDFADGEIASKELPIANPDLVIMDIGLPGISGIECMLLVKEKCPEMGILMFTVFDDNEVLFSALASGANGYILKDEKPEGVISAVRSYFAGGAPMSPQIAKKIMDSFHQKEKHKVPSIEILTLRQQEILEHVSQGFLNKEIAAKLDITEGSVKVQISRIYKKLQVNNRVEAVNKYKRG